MKASEFATSRRFAATPHGRIAYVERGEGSAAVFFHGAFLDALQLDRVDVVGNDSGGAIAQVFAAHHPERVRTLCLTNCDVYTNSPPALFRPTVETIRTVGGQQLVRALLSNPRLARSRRGFGLAYERP